MYYLSIFLYHNKKLNINKASIKYFEKLNKYAFIFDVYNFNPLFLKKYLDDNNFFSTLLSRTSDAFFTRLMCASR